MQKSPLQYALIATDHVCRSQTQGNNPKSTVYSLEVLVLILCKSVLAKQHFKLNIANRVWPWFVHVSTQMLNGNEWLICTYTLVQGYAIQRRWCSINIMSLGAPVANSCC